MKINHLITVAIFLFTATFISAQDIKYISYFPVPFASHEKLNVKTLSILGSQGDAEITAGSTSNITGTVLVNSSFYSYGDLTLDTENDPAPATGVQLVAGSITTFPSSPSYNGTLSSSANIQVATPLSGVTSLTADRDATIKGLTWGSSGGLGINGSGSSNWPSACSGKNLVWVTLKVSGSDSYRTYLTCGGTPGGGTSGGCTGECSTGQTASCGGGNGVKTCSSTCSWGTCTCNNGYTWSGSTCVAVSTVTAKVINTTAIIGSSGSDQVCSPGTGGWYNSNQIDERRCMERTQSNCYNDYLTSSDQDAYTCTVLSMSACPSTNYQALCDQNGAGYKCRISASGDSKRIDYCQCGWYGSCVEVPGSCSFGYIDGEGEASYLSCE